MKMLPERRPATVKFLNFCVECHWHSKNCFSCGSLWREFVWWLDMVESGSTWNWFHLELHHHWRISTREFPTHSRNDHSAAQWPLNGPHQHESPSVTIFYATFTSVVVSSERTRMGRLKWFSRVLANIRQFKRECSSHRPILNRLFVHLLCAHFSPFC